MKAFAFLSLRSWACLAGLYMLLAAGVSAAKTWDGEAGTAKWSDATNWLPDGVPSAADDVVLDNSIVTGSYTVTMDTVGNNFRTMSIGYSGNANTITFQCVGVSASATPIFTMAGDGTAADDLVVDQGGRLEYILITAGGGVPVTTAVGNSTRFKNGSYIYYNTNRSYSNAFPAPGTNGGATYEPNSTLEVVAGSTNLTLSNRTFGNVIYSGSGTLSNSASTPTVYQGTVKIGVGVTVQPTWSAGGTGTFQGNIINSGTLTLVCTGTGTSTFQGNITNNGAVTLTGAAANGIIFSGNLTLDGTPVSPLVLAGAGSGSIPSGSSLNVNSALTVNAGLVVDGTMTVNGTLQGGSGTISGAGSLAVASGATLGIKNSGGINGQITAAGPNSYNAGATYLYNGTAAQVTGAALPVSVANLITSNTAGVTLSGNAAAGSVLNLAAGALNTGGFNLSAGETEGSITRTSGYVIGGLTRNFDGTGSGVRTYPVGTANGYSPVTINVTTPGSAAGTITVSATQGAHPNVFDSAHTLARYWIITPSATPDYTAALTFQYRNGDVQGTEAQYLAGRYTGTGTVWQDYSLANLDTINHIATITGVTAFSPWTLGEPKGITAASVSSISLGGASPTNASSNTFDITFSQSVTGVSSSNFQLVPSAGVSGASISNVSGSGTAWTVIVNGITGNGTLGLNMANDSGVIPGVSNLPFTGTVYTIDQNVPAPVLSSAVGTHTNTFFTVSADFGENVTGFDSTQVAVSNGTVSNFVGASGSQNYSWRVTPNAEGAVTVQVLAGVSMDAAGNLNVNSNTIPTIYDTTLPSVDQQTPNAGQTINALTTVTLHFSEPVTGVTAGALTVNGSAATILSGSGDGPYIFSGFTAPADGTVNISLNGTATLDAAGNAVASPVNWTYTKNSTAIAVTLASATVASGEATNASPVHFTTTFSASVSGFTGTSVDIATSGTISNLAGGPTVYTFDVMPPGQGAVSVQVRAGAANGTAAPNNPNVTSNLYNFIYDTVAPQIASVSNVLGQDSTVRVTFDGPVNGAATSANYTINDDTGGLGTISNGAHPVSAVSAGGNAYDLTFTGTLGLSGNVRITVSNITDGAGNAVTPSSNTGSVPVELSTFSVE